MSKGEFLGAFEEVVLLALLQLGDEAYGMTVRREIEGRGQRSVSIGAVYSTLDRLEAKGYVSSRAADPSPARRGRARRYFTVEAAGAQALARTREMTNRMWRGLKPGAVDSARDG